MQKKSLFSILYFLTLFPSLLIGQYSLFSQFGSSAYVDVKTHIGKPILYSDSLVNSLKKGFYAIDYRFGINSFDRMPQDQLLNFPNYGIGFTHFQMQSDTIGNPMGLYGYFASPFFVNKQNFKLGFELAAGFSFNFNKFNLITNPKNDLIGSKLNVYFNLSLLSSTKISERWDMLLSADFTHFSNGTMNTPNKGLNLYGGNLGLRYHFQFEEKKKGDFLRRTSATGSFGAFKPYNEFSVWAGVGGKTVLVPTYDAPVYFCTSISSDFSRRYGLVGKAGFGFDYFMDYSLVADFPNETDLPISRFSFVGIHASHEFLVGDFSLILQLGSYLWKGMEAKGAFYIRTGLRYDFINRTFINLSLKSANGLKADYIELGMGYRWGKPMSN